jgi:hypothetical protein
MNWFSIAQDICHGGIIMGHCDQCGKFDTELITWHHPRNGHADLDLCDVCFDRKAIERAEKEAEEMFIRRLGCHM